MRLTSVAILLVLGLAVQARPQGKPEAEEAHTPLPGGEGSVNPANKPVIVEKLDDSTTHKPEKKDSSEEDGSAEEAGRKRRQAEEEHKTPLPGGEGSVNPANKPVIVEKLDDSTTHKPEKKDSSEEDGSAEEAGRKRRQAEEPHPITIEGGEGSIDPSRKILIAKLDDESTTHKPEKKDSSEEKTSAEKTERKKRQAEEEHKTPLPGGEGSVNPANKPVIVEKLDDSTTHKPEKKDSSEEDGSAEEAGRKRRQAEEEHKTPLPGGEGSVHKPEVTATKVESDESPESSEEHSSTTHKSA
jgi:hypothetical protein